MTETQRNTLRIPSREEFHRYASNLIEEYDFCTRHPSNQINKVADSISWTYTNEKKRNSNYNYKH